MNAHLSGPNANLQNPSPIHKTLSFFPNYKIKNPILFLLDRIFALNPLKLTAGVAADPSVLRSTGIYLSINLCCSEF